jgi:hypothetical protein
MPSNITVSITAESADLQAQLALAQSRLREFSAETRAMADQVRAGGQAAANTLPQFEAMAAATAQAKAQVAALNAEIRGNSAASVGIFGSLREGIEDLASPMQALTGLFRLAGEAFIAGFAVDKIAGLATSVAAFGEQLTRLSEETGLSTTQLSALKFGADLTGTSFDNFGRVLSRFATSLQTSITTPSGPAARALQALGITQEQVREHSDDLAGMLELVAQRLDQFSAGGNRAAIEAAIFGQRMGPELTPLLEKLAHDGFQGLIDKGREAGAVMDEEAAAKAAQAAETFHKLSVAVTDLNRVLGEWLLPTLTGIAGLLTSIADGARNVVEWFERMGVTAGDVARLLAPPGLAPLWKGMNGGAGPGAPTDAFGFGSGGLGSGVPFKQQAPSMAGGDDAQAKQEAEMQDFLTQVFTENQQRQLQTSLQTNQQELAEDQAYYSAKEALIRADAAEGKISAEQEYQQLVALEDQKFQKQTASLEERRQLMTGDEAAQSQILSQEAIAYQKHLQDMARLDQQYYQQKQREAQQESQSEKALLSALESAESSFISNVLGGRRTLTQSLIQLGTQLVEKEIADDLKALTTYVITENAKKALEQGGLAYHLFAEEAKTTATETGAAARAAADQNSFAGGLAAEAASAIKWIFNEAIKTFAGIFGFLSPEMGPAAAGPAAAGEATVMAAAGSVLSAQGGAWSLPSDQLIFAHRQESVLPASVATPMRNFFSDGAQSSGGPVVNLNVSINAMNARNVQQALADPLSGLTKTLKTFARNFSSDLRAAMPAR